MSVNKAADAKWLTSTNPYRSSRAYSGYTASRSSSSSTVQPDTRPTFTNQDYGSSSNGTSNNETSSSNNGGRGSLAAGLIAQGYNNPDAL
ncbi:uncharacterized protein L201_004665 [Kwoniella dendrophila CBS 6074]|uniref:Uncharacterized protein n=1 Tax=Kwoniella dendrophila CBS 6074 TaxID=1295534 RepID=A0AAX4JWC1_9TREE